MAVKIQIMVGQLTKQCRAICPKGSMDLNQPVGQLSMRYVCVCLLDSLTIVVRVCVCVYWEAGH